VGSVYNHTKSSPNLNSFVLDGIKILAITLYSHHTPTTFIIVDACDSKNIDGLLHEVQQLVSCR
jgi:hypothetical protein